MKEIILKYALQNAVFYNGKADPKAVIGKIFAENPDLRKKAKGVVLEVEKAVKEVNKMKFDEQKKKLENLAPELLEKKEKAQRVGLQPLPNAEMGKVVTRFPPEPNGYPHIGHAKAAIIDETYARMYDGKFILRFDDTNPAKEKKEYYEAILDGINWLGLKPDIIKNTSDDIEEMYKYAEKLIKDGHAYVCICRKEQIKECRAKGIGCECRKKSPKENMDGWKKMFSTYKENEASLRLKVDMKHQNTVLRDPTLFRIVTTKHQLLGNKYRVWPTYDFSVPVEDHIDGVTHPMRSKEYEMRDQLYQLLVNLLGLRKMELYDFSRLAIEGTPLSKRKIKPLLEEHVVKGWDDPRLATLVALKRRGILPEAIREFVLSQGMSKSESVIVWDNIESYNRRLLDPIAKRYYFVADPIKCVIKKLPKTKVEIPLHPEKAEYGKKEYDVDGTVYLSNSDVELLKKNKKIRLMHLCNIRVNNIGKTIEAEYTGTEMEDIPKIHWVPEKSLSARVLVAKPLFTGEELNKHSLDIVEGLVEPAITNVKVGEVIQFERFGFCRLDKAGKEPQFVFSHK